MKNTTTPNAEESIEGMITYSFATPHSPKKDILYVNIIPNYSCVNSCRFCSRQDAINGLPNLYETKAGGKLYLPKSPSIEEVVNAIEANRKKGIFNLFNQTKEIAFVGLGEPLLQFELVRDSIIGIRKKGYNGKVRVDTNGLVKNWYGRYMCGCPEMRDMFPARQLRRAGLDEIRISVNAISENEYQALCRPPYENAFEKLCEFAKECVEGRIDTKASFVIDFDDGEVKTKSEAEYRNFAHSLGIKPKNVIFRKFIQSIR